MPEWTVYILRCRDGSLYTGITTDPERRLAEHNSDRGAARYTRPRRPVRLVYTEPAAALRLEWQTGATLRPFVEAGGDLRRLLLHGRRRFRHAPDSGSAARALHS